MSVNGSCLLMRESCACVWQDELRALQQQITNKIDMGNAYVSPSYYHFIVITT